MFDSTNPEVFEDVSVEVFAAADEALGLIAAGLEMLRSEDRAGWSTAARSSRVVELGRISERVQAETVRAVAVWDRNGDYAADGSLSGTAWIAHRVPMTRVNAARLVAVGRVCRRSERVEKALDAGDVTTSHVEQIARVIKVRRTSSRLMVTCSSTRPWQYHPKSSESRPHGGGPSPMMKSAPATTPTTRRGTS